MGGPQRQPAAEEGAPNEETMRKASRVGSVVAIDSPAGTGAVAVTVNSAWAATVVF